MSERRGSSTDMHWGLPLSRAVAAIAVAAAITFIPNHSAAFGLLAFGIVGVCWGLVLVGWWIATRAGGSRTGVARAIMVTIGVISLAAGVAALVVPSGGLAYLVFLIAAYAAFAGGLELYLGLRSRRKGAMDASAGDWLFVGGFTVLLAIVVLVVPPDLAQGFTGPDGVARTLTSAVVVVGVFGAYLAVLGVFLTIASLSLRTDPKSLDVQS